MTGASLPGLLLLWRSASDYVFTASRDTARFGANDIPGNQSIRGMLLRSDLPDGLVSPCWLVVSLVLLASPPMERGGSSEPASGWPR